MIDRILKGTGATISVQVTVDGAATNPDPDSATLTVRDSAGATLINAAVTTDTGTGEFSYNLTPAHTAALDTLTATWTYTRDGNTESLTTTHEIVGGFLFTIADAYRMLGRVAVNNDDSYKAGYEPAAVALARTDVERSLEHELAFAMAPRYTLETVSGEGAAEFMLSMPYPRAIRSVTVDGTALSVGQLATVSMGVTGSLYYPGGWPRGTRNIVVGYEHGLTVPPPGATRIALALAKRWLVGAPADDRATTMSTEEQTTQFYVPGASEPFDVPAANRFVASHTLRTGIA